MDNNACRCAGIVVLISLARASFEECPCALAMLPENGTSCAEFKRQPYCLLMLPSPANRYVGIKNNMTGRQCTGKWNLADCPENYVHSSAGFYYKGVQGIYPVDNIMNLMDIDLNERMQIALRTPGHCRRISPDKKIPAQQPLINVISCFDRHHLFLYKLTVTLLS